MKWMRENLGFVCPHCGTANPDKGDRCGNCDQNPFELPPKDELLTAEQLAILRAVISGPKKFSRGS